MRKRSGVGPFYRAHFLALELLVSLIAGGIVDYGVSIRPAADRDKWLDENATGMYQVLAAIGGTLLGFVLTGVSILLAFPETPRIELLKESPHYREIYTIYFSSIRYLALLTVVSVIGLAANRSPWREFTLYVVVWATIIVSLRLWRCAWVLEALVALVLKDRAEVQAPP
jgi:hypothetical protein